MNLKRQKNAGFVLLITENPMHHMPVAGKNENCYFCLSLSKA
jgi:hypothetical protein